MLNNNTQLDSIVLTLCAIVCGIFLIDAKILSTIKIENIKADGFIKKYSKKRGSETGYYIHNKKGEITIVPKYIYLNMPDNSVYVEEKTRILYNTISISWTGNNQNQSIKTPCLQNNKVVLILFLLCFVFSILKIFNVITLSTERIYQFVGFVTLFFILYFAGKHFL